MHDPKFMQMGELIAGPAPDIIQLLDTKLTKLNADKYTIRLSVQNILFGTIVSDPAYVIYMLK